MLAPIGASSCFLAKAALEFSWPREPWKIMLAPIGAGSCSLAKASLEVHVSAYRRWFMFLGVFLAKGALEVQIAPIGAGSCSLAKAVLEVHVSAYRH